MKANELRIGNWVFVEDKPLRIWAIDLDYHDEGNGLFSAGDYGYQEFRSAEIKPIPLTEEWLVKFGFTGRTDFKWKGIVGIQFSHNEYYIALKDLSNVIFHSLVKIEYVHQLQNLYFALTGEEIEQ